MSAGNTVLSAGTFAPTVFPIAQTVLASGNYWLEEIDFTLAYINVNAGTTAAFQLYLSVSPAGNVIWNQDFAIITAAATIVQMNLPVISRPRIFLLRGNSVLLNITSPGATVTQMVFSMNLYGRALP